MASSITYSCLEAYYGVKGCVLDLFKICLSERKQYVTAKFLQTEKIYIVAFPKDIFIFIFFYFKYIYTG